MKLRFEVNQAECLRRGIDCPKSIITVEVEPSKLTQQQRDLIADRMDGIDVLRLKLDGGKPQKRYYTDREGIDAPLKPYRIEANAPTFEGLMEAIHANQKEVEAGK